LLAGDQPDRTARADDADRTASSVDGLAAAALIQVPHQFDDAAMCLGEPHQGSRARKTLASLPAATAPSRNAMTGSRTTNRAPFSLQRPVQDGHLPGESYTYNALGQIATKTDRNGNTHSYSYDVLGRQTSD